MRCLLPNKIDDFKKALKDKDVKLADLINLDHDELVKKLEPFAGKNAQEKERRYRKSPAVVWRL